MLVNYRKNYLNAHYLLSKPSFKGISANIQIIFQKTAFATFRRLNKLTINVNFRLTPKQSFL